LAEVCGLRTAEKKSKVRGEKKGAEGNHSDANTFFPGSLMVGGVQEERAVSGCWPAPGKRGKSRQTGNINEGGGGACKKPSLNEGA